MKDSQVGASVVARQSRQSAEKMLRECLEDGEVLPSKHFLEELAKEGVNFQDAHIVLRAGRIYNEPEEDIRTGEWKYQIEGKEPDGRNLGIVFCFKAIRRTFLITVFSVTTARKRKR